MSGYTLGCGPGGASFGVPYAAFPYSTINDIFDVGRAHYNSLQTTVSRRWGAGYFQAAYTFSRSTDATSTPRFLPVFPK